MIAKEHRQSLKGITNKPSPEGFWLLDLNGSSACADLDLSRLSSILTSDLLVLSDAKAFLADLTITPSADMRLICLSTINNY